MPRQPISSEVARRVCGMAAQVERGNLHPSEFLLAVNALNEEHADAITNEHIKLIAETGQKGPGNKVDMGGRSRTKVGTSPMSDTDLVGILRNLIMRRYGS
jgi:hypothetical protein